MVFRSLKLPVFLAATTFVVAPVTEAFASGACTVKTARQSAGSPGVLCECDSVTSGMLRYIQRRADFQEIVARLGAECSPLADLLTDLPTASIGASDQRAGDGPANEGQDTGLTGGPGPSGPSGSPETTGGETPGGEGPRGGEPDGEQPGGEQPGGEEPGGEEPGGEEPGGEEPGGEEPGGEEPGGEEPGGEEPGGEEPGEELR